MNDFVESKRGEVAALGCANGFWRPPRRFVAK